MKDVGKFLLKALGITILVISIFWIGFSIWNSMTPVCESSTSEMVNTPSGDITFVQTQEEKICRFVDGYDSYGKVVPSGTQVTGPAFVKPDRDLDWAIPIYVGEEYQTKASDEVVWMLLGDNACVDAQSIFFSHWGPINPK